jgi:ABC-type transporter Mla subunit MlaD
VLEEEYRRGIRGFGQTATAFRELTEATAAQVESLPNPADRLAGLWDGVRQLETALTDALAGSIQELTVLRERSEHLRTALTALAGSADQAAQDVRAGGGELREALLREVRQMNSIIEEYTRLLEGTSRSLAGRR